MALSFPNLGRNDPMRRASDFSLGTPVNQPMTAPASMPRSKSMFGGVLDYMGQQNPQTGLSRAEGFAAALDPLVMPSMRSGEAIRQRGDQRMLQQKRNKTADYLEKISPDAAALLREGYLSPSDALKVANDSRTREMAKAAGDAFRAGNMQEAMAILTEMSPTAMGQQIAAQSMQPPSEIIGNGKYTVSYPDGINGEPVITVNEDVITAEQKIAQDKRKIAPMPTDARKAEESDFEAITAIDNLMEDISNIVDDFGYDPEKGDFTGPLDIGLSGFLKGTFGALGMGGEGAAETAEAREEFERFKTRLINISLRLNKGVQTEGDAQRVAKELGNAYTERTAYAAIQELLKINQRARKNRVSSINRRRENFGVQEITVPTGTVPDLQWKVKKQ